MAAKGTAKRVQQALDVLAVAEDPESALEAARRVREAAEELEFAKVQELRKAGASWSRIGALFGTTKQGAQQRFGATSKRGLEAEVKA